MVRTFNEEEIIELLEAQVKDGDRGVRVVGDRIYTGPNGELMIDIAIQFRDGRF